MATSVYVVDSSFKRTQIKVTPGKYLREVLEEACKSRKLNPEEYSLKSQTNKTLDLSQPFRLSGLSAGAKLQLTQASKSPGVVSVALQLPESEGGGRLSDKFPSTTSLWLILRKYEDAVAGSSSTKLNLTQRGAPSTGTGAGRLMYQQPCLNLMGRNLDNIVDLQKTLAQLGLNSGTALLRLTFKATDFPLEDAMRDIQSFFDGSSLAPKACFGSSSTPDENPASAAANGAVETVPETTAAPLEEEKATSEDVSVVPEPTPAQMDGAPVETAPAPSPPSEAPPELARPERDTINGISVYRPPTSGTPAAALHNDDPSVFEPTIDHAKSHQAHLQQAGKNKRLLSDKELEEQESARREKLASVNSVLVRVRYPDQSQIETTVYRSESAADLYAKVAETLAAGPDEPFELRYTGSVKTHEVLPNTSSKALVRDFGFRGKVLVTLVWLPEASAQARQGPSLREEYRRHAKDLKVELQTQQAVGESAHRTAMAKTDAKGASAGAAGEGKKEDLESKMKKFLGFKKK